jgi:hypothetical protein
MAAKAEFEASWEAWRWMLPRSLRADSRKERMQHPRFESVIPALFWARLVRGAAVHGLRWPGSAFGFGIEIHRLRRSHPSIP